MRVNARTCRWRYSEAHHRQLFASCRVACGTQNAHLGCAVNEMNRWKARSKRSIRHRMTTSERLKSHCQRLAWTPPCLDQSVARKCILSRIIGRNRAIFRHLRHGGRASSSSPLGRDDEKRGKKRKKEEKQNAVQQLDDIRTGGKQRRTRVT